MTDIRNCLHCGQETTNPKFCTRSCAASYNNRLYIKRPSLKTTCPDCGGRKRADALRCHHCKVVCNLGVQLSRTLEDCTYPGPASVRWSHVRKVARRVLKLSGRSEACVVCGFDIAVECCHIIPISSFPDDVLLSEVNSLSNLVYLCPNHHLMFDRGLIDLAILTGIEPVPSAVTGQCP